MLLQAPVLLPLPLPSSRCRQHQLVMQDLTPLPQLAAIGFNFLKP
jgi:hypothetical protein